MTATIHTQAQDERRLIIVMESINPAGIELLAQNHRVVQLSGPRDPRLSELLPLAEALIVRSTRVTAEIIEGAPMLKVIGRHGAGTENIDLDAARSHQVAVVNTPGSNANSVAEYVITVALMMLKRVDEVSTKLRSGYFTSSEGSLPGQVDRNGLAGREASACTLGLVGVGAIGRAVATRAKALGFTVLGYDAYPQAHDPNSPIRFLADLDSLLSSSDILTLHIPGGEANRSLIDQSKLALMKPGSILINAARGEVVDNQALIHALETGHLAGAAVDVFDPEPPEANNPLFRAPNLIMTPHMAATTHEALVRMSVDVADGVIAALDNAL